MAKADLNTLATMTEDEARAKLEASRWPNGTVCPKCGTVGESYRMESKAGSSTRRGLWRCRSVLSREPKPIRCGAQFTATVGTIFEDSHIPLSKWFMAMHLLCASKKGMSAHQLHLMLGITYKSAWFMAHRIRYAMSQPPLVDKLRGVVEADETFVGGKPSNRHVGKREPAPPKIPVLALVERGGKVRSMAVRNLGGATLRSAVRKHISTSARIMTDGHPSYKGLDKEFAGHEAVNREANEYVRGDAHSNAAESYFALLKRGIIGTYHHVSGQHLPRYLAEFDQRWTSPSPGLVVSGPSGMLVPDGPSCTAYDLRQAEHCSRRLEMNPAQLEAPTFLALHGHKRMGAVLLNEPNAPGISFKSRLDPLALLPDGRADLTRRQAL